MGIYFKKYCHTQTGLFQWRARFEETVARDFLSLVFLHIATQYGPQNHFRILIKFEEMFKLEKPQKIKLGVLKHV
jgi:hypothetical protein